MNHLIKKAPKAIKDKIRVVQIPQIKGKSDFPFTISKF